MKGFEAKCDIILKRMIEAGGKENFTLGQLEIAVRAVTQITRRYMVTDFMKTMEACGYIRKKDDSGHFEVAKYG